MTCMRSWKSHRLTSHTWLDLNPQIVRSLSSIVGDIGLFLYRSRLNHFGNLLYSLSCVCPESKFLDLKQKEHQKL
jgi:hypothetical protein